jgi:hypothetical protein
MKRFFLKTIIITSLIFQACSDYLVEENKSNLSTEDYYTTAEGYNSLINSCYSTLRTIYGGYPKLFCSGTDLYTEAYASAYTPSPLGEYLTLNPLNKDVEDFYNQCFEAIGLTNTALYFANKTVKTSKLERQIAEVRFLRAFYYFHLVQQFGGVAIVTQMTTSPTFEFPRRSEEAVYDFIIDEMESVVDFLPDRNADEDYGRIDKRTVYFFLAKAYLTRGWLPFGSPSDFNKAKEYADLAIAGFQFSLTFEQAYKATNLGYRNDEVIWSVIYSPNTIPTQTSGNVQQALFGTHLGSTFGHKNTDKAFSVTLYGHYLFSKDIVDPNKDSRYKATFMEYIYESYWMAYTKTENELKNTKIMYYYPMWWQNFNQDEWIAVNPATRSNTIIRYISDPGNPKTDLAAFQEATREYVSGAGLSFWYPTVRKFDCPESAMTNSQSASFRDVDIARMADAFLTAAEACIKLNKPAEAVSYINAVRSRSIDVSEPKRMINEDQATIEFLLEERARELLGHYDRWYDLKRTNMLINQAVKFNPDLANNPNHFKGQDGNNKILRPIPQNAIDQNKARIEQNPGY